MKIKLILPVKLLLGLLVVLLFSSDVFAAKYKRKDSQGSFYYTCSRPGWDGGQKSQREEIIILRFLGLIFQAGLIPVAQSRLLQRLAVS